jgi:putative ABC transport system permease protein
MWYNYLLIALRNLKKQRIFTLINVAGLAIGMAACLLIFQYLRYENGYDRQSPHHARIWRVYNENLPNGGPITRDANTHSAVGPALAADLPEVQAFTRLFNHGENEIVVRREQNIFPLSPAWMVDTGFLTLFPQRFLAGDPVRCLQSPWQMVLTRSAAQQFFGTASALGQTLQVPGGHFAGTYQISGVVEDPAPNTHLKFGALVSYETRHAKGHPDNWDDYWEYNYVLLQAGADPEKMRRQLARYSEQYLANQGIRLDMQPLDRIHLYSDLSYEIEPNGSARVLRFLTIVALFILGIAFINFVNLSTARALQRAREVGLRKAIGARRVQVMGQFLLEGALLNGLAMLVCLFLVQQGMPWLEQVTGKPLSAGSGFDGVFWAVCGALLLGGILLACWYPAWMMSRYQPTEVLKGRLSSGREGLRLREGLVVVQFASSIALILGVLVVLLQLDFLKKHDKGLSLNQLLALKTPALEWNDTLGQQRFADLKTDIARLAGVQSVSVSSAAPGLGISTISGTNSGMFWVRAPDLAQMATVYFWNVDAAFFSTYGIPILAGAYPEAAEERQRREQVLINESAMKMFGFREATEALGQEVAYRNAPESRMRISGVVRDFHIESLKTTPKPTLYFANPAQSNGYMSIKMTSDQTMPLLSSMEALWKARFPDAPFDYRFMDSHFESLYRAEQQFSTLFGAFAALAVLIACLGLYGLAAYAAERRKKEIGIRKILGASVQSIVAMLSRDFIRLVLVALVIGAPIAWYLMQHWLDNFAYRIYIRWWMPLAAGLAALLIALATVSTQSWRAARKTTSE